MRRILLLGVAALCAIGVGGASATTLPTTVLVTDDMFAANEESLAMDPSGNVLLGMWNDWHYNDGCGISYSTDGGKTWAPESFAPGFTFFTNDPNVAGSGPFAVAGDPVVVYNPLKSRFDVICQAFGGRNGNQIQLLATTFDPGSAQRNEPDLSYGSAAWGTVTAIATGKSNGSQKGSNGKFPDHEAATVDTGDGPGHHYGRLYVTWAEFSGFGKSPIDLAYSDNDGLDWTGPIRVSDAGHQFDQDATPRVGPDGTVYVTFINGPNEKSTKNNAAMIAKSTDGGDTWSKSYVAASIPSPATSLPNSLYRGGTDVTSTVDQQTGDVFVAFGDQSEGGALNVWVTHTTKSGDLSSFTRAAPVNPSKQTQFFPWLQSAPNGRVDLVYYDRTCDPNDVLNCVTLSSTMDDGDNWTNTPVTATGFDGDTFGVCLEDASGDPCSSTDYFLGDYIAVASNDDKAQVMWTGNGDHTLDVFTAAVTR